MKKISVFFAGIVAAFTSSVTIADVVYQQVLSGTYGQASGFDANGFAGINVSVDNSGVARLVTYSYTSTDGYKLWYGEIPASAVTVNGVASIAVQIDTCSVDATLGCGYVDATVNMDPHGYGFITNGSTQYSWDNIIVVVAGPVQVHAAQITGYVNGVQLDGKRSFIGKYTTSSIEVQTGN